MENENIIACADCGCIIETVEHHDNNGAPVCDLCADNYVSCADCGDTLRADEIEYYDDAGDPICESCADNYMSCDNCGVVMTPGAALSFNHGDGGYVCQTCVDRHYHTCAACGEVVDDSHITYSDDNGVICDRCDGDYRVCDDCCTIILCDNGHHDWDTGIWYCDDCYGNHEEHDLHDYSYKPCPIFLPDSSAVGYYGVEIETDNGRDPRELASNIQALSNDIYCKHDGSLTDGVEIVSHPATLNYHMQTLDWADIFDTARRAGFRSHDTSTCGLHVHASRELLGEGWLEQQLTAAKIMLVFDRFWDSHIVPFSRRDVRKIDQWSRKPCADLEPTDDDDTIADKINTVINRGRYCAINLQNTHTIEFRIFRGTLKLSTLYATLQFVDTMIQFCKRTSLNELWSIAWPDIFKGADYPELQAYLLSKNLMEDGDC